MNIRKTALYLIFTLSVCGCEKSAQLIHALNEKIDHREESFISNREQQLKDDINAHQVVMTDDQVIFAKSHLASVKTARFQPSFSLQGVIAPINSLTLNAPIDTTVNAVFVKTGETVKKNQLLALLTPNKTTSQLTNNSDGSDSDSDNDSDGNLDGSLIDDLDTADTLANDLADDLSSPDDLTATHKNSHQSQAAKDEDAHHPIRIVAPFGGVIGDIAVKVGEHSHAHTPLLTLHDIKKYQFISHLPAHLKPHIKIGNTVELTVEGRPFSGQVAGVNDNQQNFHQFDVQVEISTKKDSNQRLAAGQFAKGVIEYGQIEVGSLVPDFAIMNDDLTPMNLTDLYTPPHKPQASIPAYIWVVKQNAKLQLAPIHVIEYLPNTRRFLVSGITQDSLIVLTSLPKSANGKQVVVK